MFSISWKILFSNFFFSFLFSFRSPHFIFFSISFSLWRVLQFICFAENALCTLEQFTDAFTTRIQFIFVYTVYFIPIRTLNVEVMRGTVAIHLNSEHTYTVWRSGHKKAKKLQFLPSVLRPSYLVNVQAATIAWLIHKVHALNFMLKNAVYQISKNIYYFVALSLLELFIAFNEIANPILLAVGCCTRCICCNSLHWQNGRATI